MTPAINNDRSINLFLQAARRGAWVFQELREGEVEVFGFFLVFFRNADQDFPTPFWVTTTRFPNPLQVYSLSKILTSPDPRKVESNFCKTVSLCPPILQTHMGFKGRPLIICGVGVGVKKISIISFFFLSYLPVPFISWFSGFVLIWTLGAFD